MNFKKTLLIGAPSLIAIALIAIVVMPTLREQLQNYFIKDVHEVLATAEGDLLGDGSVAKVIKFRSKDGIFVEVLRVEANGSTQMIDRIILPDKHDGLFNFQGHVTRLVIADVDHDGKAELVAPSFDNQLVPHLNVFKFNPTTRHFELFQPSK